MQGLIMLKVKGLLGYFNRKRLKTLYCFSKCLKGGGKCNSSIPVHLLKALHLKYCMVHAVGCCNGQFKTSSVPLLIT